MLSTKAIRRTKQNPYPRQLITKPHPRTMQGPRHNGNQSAKSLSIKSILKRSRRYRCTTSSRPTLHRGLRQQGLNTFQRVQVPSPGEELIQSTHSSTPHKSNSKRTTWSRYRRDIPHVLRTNGLRENQNPRGNFTKQSIHTQQRNISKSRQRGASPNITKGKWNRFNRNVPTIKHRTMHMHKANRRVQFRSKST